MFSAMGPERRWLRSRASSRSMTSHFRSRKVSGSSASRAADSLSDAIDAFGTARPPRPATTVYSRSGTPHSAFCTLLETMPPWPTAKHFSTTTTRFACPHAARIAASMA